MQCPICDKESLKIISPEHPEYYYTTLTNDGTKKAFECSSCDGVYIWDKIRRRWEFSPKTYDKLLKENIIKDFLE